MHRIDRDALRSEIFVAIKTMKIGKTRGGKHPIPEFRENTNIDTLVGKLLNIIDGECRMVIRTEERPQSHGVRGKWGVDEPWPPGCEPGANDPPPPPRINRT